MFSFRRTVLLPLVLILPSPLFAQMEEVDNGTALGATNLNEHVLRSSARNVPWPSGARPRLRAELGEVVFDNIPMTMIQLIGPVNFISQPFPDWSVAENTPPQYSIQFEHRNFPEYKWSISLFREGEFLPETYPAEAFVGYAKTILRRATENRRVEMITDMSRWQQGDVMEHFFSGGTTYNIQWREIDLTQESVTRHFQYFLPENGNLIVYTVEGPEQDFESYFERAKDIFTYLQRVY